ncbi:MAG TPA: hypothetical protein VF170_00780, partial [Planctomycetaceae bacterium]
QLVACTVVDILIVRAVWRRVRMPAPASPSDAAPSAPASEPPAEGPDAAAPPRRSRRDLIAAVAALGIAAGLFGVKAWHEGWGPFDRSDSYRPVAPSAPTPPGLPRVVTDEQAAVFAEDANRRWRLGPDGPELSPGWAQSALRIDASTKEAIDAILRNVYAEYEQLLDAHTDVTFEGEAIRFRVRPFVAELDRLSNRFWERVDPLLNRDQQAVMRYNFPLRYQRPQGGYTVQGLYEDKVMPFGDDEGQALGVRIERSGQWYRWELLTSHPVPIGTTAPELPVWLRRWQERYDLLTSLRRAGVSVDPRRTPLIAPKP